MVICDGAWARVKTRSQQQRSAQMESRSRVILIPVDGSKNSDRALEWYFSNLLTQGDSVLLIHAFEQVPMQTAKHASVDFNHTYDAWCSQIKDIQEKARKRLGRYEEKLAQYKDKLSYRLCNVAGPPGEAIIKCAKNENASFIVIGSRGLGKLRRTILGSVSDFVVHHAKIPVTVVPPS